MVRELTTGIFTSMSLFKPENITTIYDTLKKTITGGNWQGLSAKHPRFGDTLSADTGGTEDSTQNRQERTKIPKKRDATMTTVEATTGGTPSAR